jgi:hypothetical protein
MVLVSFLALFSVFETLDFSISFLDCVVRPKCHHWSLFSKMSGSCNSFAEKFEQILLLIFIQTKHYAYKTLTATTKQTESK